MAAGLSVQVVEAEAGDEVECHRVTAAQAASEIEAHLDRRRSDRKHRLQTHPRPELEAQQQLAALSVDLVDA